MILKNKFMFNLLTIGDIVIDTHIQIDNASLECSIKQKPCQLCLEYASKIPIKNSFQSLGGNAANVAVGAKKLGMNTAIISSVGDDANGELAIEELNKHKINTDLIYKEKNNATRYSVILNFKGERTILSYHGKRKYVWPSKTIPPTWLYYTGLSKGSSKIQEKLLHYLAKHPTINTAYNPGSFQLKNRINEVKEMIQHTDILIVNLEEAQKILKTTLKKVKTVQALIHKLINLGDKCREVLITDSKNGAYVGSLNEIWHIDSFPIKVVAKTGAGDAFSTGYISARHRGYNKPQSLTWGVANSCGVISKPGTQNGLLDQRQIEKMIAKYKDIKPKLMK